MSFDEIIRLQPEPPTAFVGRGPRYPWGGLYGGQIVAQAYAAAAATVEPRFHAHSLHAYFIRRGDHEEPVRYVVERPRDGRSFVTRSVVAHQEVGAILHLSASFQVQEQGAVVDRVRMSPDVPRPDELPVDRWTDLFDRRVVPATEPGLFRAWLRMDVPVDPDPVSQLAALAFLSDDSPTEAVMTLHPVGRPASGEEWPYFSASLDHSMWLHRPIDAQGWQLHEFRCDALMGSRGLARGYVFDESGRLAASVNQEVLIRHPDDR